MDTYCAVDDDKLVSLIRSARRTIHFAAPGLHWRVARALCERFDEVQFLQVTLILDPDEDVFRIGFGEIEALKLVHDHANASGFFVRSQPGLRMGTLQVDKKTLVWSPTARSIEAPPDSHRRAFDNTYSPNGLMLGASAGNQISNAICAEGTDTNPSDAEIGRDAVTPEQIAKTAIALSLNPPIPVDLSRISRVFSTKLQFVELRVSHAKLSQQRISLSSALLNADASEDLRAHLESSLRAFSELKECGIQVPVYVDGDFAFDRRGNVLSEVVTEASLGRDRHAIEAEYLYEIPGFGRVIECSRRGEFEKRIAAYKARLDAHARGMTTIITNETQYLVNEAVNWLADRMSRSGVDVFTRNEYMRSISRKLSDCVRAAAATSPRVSLVFKNIDWKQTQDQDFNDKLCKVLPPAVRRCWFEKFSAVGQVPMEPPHRTSHGIKIPLTPKK